MTKDSRIESLLEAHLQELKNINEGMRSLLVVQNEMKEELADLRSIKNEWPVVKTTIKNTNKDVKKLNYKVDRVESKLDNLDNQVTRVLPDHEKRITKVETGLELAKK